jgi:hypothetical protein
MLLSDYSQEEDTKVLDEYKSEEGTKVHDEHKSASLYSYEALIERTKREYEQL